MTPRPSTLFLDAGGVLVEPDWERVAAVLARSGVRAEPAAMAAVEPAAKRAIDVAPTVLSTDDRRRGGMYFRTILAMAGLDLDGAALDAADGALREAHASSNLWSAVPPGVPGALAALRAAGIPLVVVSNADGSVASLLDRVGLGGFLDAVVDSGRLGVEKPDPRIFEEALRLSGARRDSTVHVGDFYEIDVVGARAAGIGAVLVDPAGVNADRDCPRFPSLAALAAAILGAR